MVEANYGKCRYLSVKWEFRKNSQRDDVRAYFGFF